MVLFICLLSLVVLVVARQKLYTSSYLLEATSYFFVTIRGSNIPILSNSLAKCLSSKNYNLSAFWKRSDRWKFTSLQSCVSFDLAPQIGWKLYILLPAMLLHGPATWRCWPSCSIWLGCQADELWPQSLHHHLLPRLPRLACRDCWVKWSFLFICEGYLGIFGSGMTPFLGLFTASLYPTFFMSLGCRQRLPLCFSLLIQYPLPPGLRALC